MNDMRLISRSLLANLQSLIVFNYPIQWDSIRDLRTLDIHLLQSDSFPGTRVLISTLRRLPRLENLSLSWGPQIDAWLYERFEDNPVALPHLQILSLTIELRTFDFLLASITFPITCAVRLVPLYIRSSAEAKPVLSRVNSLCNSLSSPIVKAVQLGASSSSQLEIRALANTTLYKQLGRSYEEELRLHIAYSPCSQIATLKLLQMTLANINVQNVTVLDLRTASHLASGLIVGRCISAFPSLTTVHICIQNSLALAFLTITSRTFKVRCPS